VGRAVPRVRQVLEIATILVANPLPLQRVCQNGVSSRSKFSKKVALLGGLGSRGGLKPEEESQKVPYNAIGDHTLQYI
jgi:hypothetical protein